MKLLKTLFFACIVLAMSSFSSSTALQTFPSVGLKTLDGQSVSTDDFVGNGNITVVSFWASWCSPCKRELDALTDFYPEWQEQYGVEVVAITIDNARGLAKVPGIVASKNWDYTILADSKQDLQRALNFQTIPQTFLLDGAGNIIYSHNGYNPGDEYELEEEILKAVE